MIIRFLRWLFRSFTPYLMGILLGIGFFVLLARFIGSPGKLLQSSPDLSQHIAWLSGAVVGDKHGNRDQESGATGVIAPTSPVAPNRVSTENNKSGDIANTTTTQSTSGSETLPHRPVAPPATAATGSLELSQPPPEKVGVKKSSGATNIPKPVVNIIEECGPPPMRPGLDQERYMACQWRRNCQINVDNYQKMITQGLQGCPENTTHAQMCRDFYHSLERQNPPQACDGPWYGNNRRN